MVHMLVLHCVLQLVLLAPAALCCLQETVRAPLPSNQLGIDDSVIVEGERIMIINDSCKDIHIRVHDNPNNLYASNINTSDTVGGSFNVSEQHRDSISVAVGPDRAQVRYDTQEHHGNQRSSNSTHIRGIMLKEKKQLPPQQIKLPAQRQQLFNLTADCKEVFVEAWYVELGTTMMVVRNMVVKRGQALRIGKDSLGCAYPETPANTTTPAAPAAGRSSGGSSAAAGGKPAIVFNC